VVYAENLETLCCAYAERKYTMTVNTKRLDPAKVTAEPIVSKGAKFLKHLKISFDEIYVPSMANNPVRKDGKNFENVNNLKQALEKGIKYNLLPPVVRKNPQFVNGKSYNYELVAGNHRWEALRDNNYKEWIFSLYEFGVDGVSDELSVQEFQLMENDHPPQLQASSDDLVNSIVKRMSLPDSDVVNTEFSIREYVNRVCKNRSASFKSGVVDKVITACGTWVDVVTYTGDDAKLWAEENGYVAGGYDAERDEHGWSVLDTRYQPKYTMIALMNYSETKKQSYFLYHTMAPTKSSSLNKKREEMIKNQKEIDKAILDVVAFVNANNGDLPWHVNGFLPQDRKANETDLIKIG